MISHNVGNVLRVDGFINVDKPVGITSNDVVAKVKRLIYPLFGRVKIGHTGTLDPLASGVLPIAIGEATKTVSFQMENRKTYEFCITFGESRTTDDAEGDVEEKTDVLPTHGGIIDAIDSFCGEIEQIPPKYSAIKINGKRAYDLARKGEDFEIKSRKNFIHSFTLLDETLNNDGKVQKAKFRVCANKGFYVRAVARDVAIKLGSLGYVSFLRRVANGPFDLENAITLDKLEKMLQNMDQSLDVRKFDDDILLPVSFGLNDILALDMNEWQNQKIRNGQWLKPDVNLGVDLKTGSFYKVLSSSKLSAIVKYDGGLLKTERVFNL